MDKLINLLNCGNTHGDYFISQLLVETDKITGVIDWTTACRHPLVWEIFRSFVYAEPECEEGNIPIYLHQAVFSTKLMKWFESNMDALMKELKKHYMGV